MPARSATAPRRGCRAARTRAPRRRSWSDRSAQFAHVARPVALLALHVRPALAEARVVVDHQHHRDAAPPRRFEFRQVIVDRAVARPADHLALARRALRAERGGERPAKRSRRAQIGLPRAVQFDQRRGPDAGIAGVGDQDAVLGQRAGDLGAEPVGQDRRGVAGQQRRARLAPGGDDAGGAIGERGIAGGLADRRVAASPASPSDRPSGRACSGSCGRVPADRCRSAPPGYRAAECARCASPDRRCGSRRTAQGRPRARSGWWAARHSFRGNQSTGDAASGSRRARRARCRSAPPAPHPAPAVPARRRTRRHPCRRR